MSDTKNEPAFPVQHYVNVDGETFMSEPTGLTKLEWFAGMALQGWISTFSDDLIDSYDGEAVSLAEHQQEVAKTCFGYAEAMIAESERRKAQR